MQAQTIAMTGSAVNIPAPCACEGFRIYSLAHTFTFQWVTRANELSPTSGVPAGQAVGAAVSAEAASTTDFWMEVVAPNGNPFQAGEVIGIAIGTNADPLYIRPVRPGGR
jgi:hypothetical protein